MTGTTTPPLPRLFIAALFLLCLGLLPQPASALEAAPYPPYSQGELAQMLAPIALYPDALLSQILMASTYPIEVVEADRWLGRNPVLAGTVLDDALFELDWDPSVKALCHFPSVLALMSAQIGATTDLGNAFLAQEAEVMAMVQTLRAEAYARGTLLTDTRQLVILQGGTIIIEPLDPAVIYVPYYDPFAVYGAWWYPAYPPYFWGPSRVSLGFGIHYWPGTHFSVSFGSWCRFDWSSRSIHIDIRQRPRFVKHEQWTVTSDRWRHAPQHRRGVAYRDRETGRNYGHPLRHVDRDRHDLRRSFERNDPHRPIGTVRQQPRPGRPDPGDDRRERSRSEQPQQVRNRPAERERAPAASDQRRHDQVRPGGIQPVVGRIAAELRNRAAVERNPRGQNQPGANRKLQERPRTEPRSPAAPPRPVSVRQAPAPTVPTSQQRQVQPPPSDPQPPRKWSAVTPENRQDRRAEVSKRTADNRERTSSGDRRHADRSRDDEGAKRKERSTERNRR